MNLESIVTNELAQPDGETMALIIGAKENLEEVQDIVDFLVVNNGAENK